MQQFRSDLDLLLTRLSARVNPQIMKGLESIHDRLNLLADRREVKINHSVMELICASHLISKGYWVEVEREIGGGMVCDLYGRMGQGEGRDIVTEVETGFVPPEESLDPTSYRRTRIASKIARYSLFSDLFALATPNYHTLQIPEVLIYPPKNRDGEELSTLAEECAGHYKNPPISLMELLSCHLDAVYIIWVDECRVVEMTPAEYIGSYH